MMMKIGSNECSSPLTALQNAFGQVYRDRKEKTLAAIRNGVPPVVVRLSDDELLLIAAQQRQSFDLETAQYDVSKQVSHIAPLAILMLDYPGELPVARQSVDAALKQLERDNLADAVANFIRHTRKLIGALDTGTESHQVLLHRYRVAVRNTLDGLAHEAARADLDTLARAMREIESGIGREALREAFLVVCGGHQSRRNELTHQFFRRWLTETFDDEHCSLHHVVYAEHRSTVDEVLELVSTRIVDEEIAKRLFGDPTRLDQDILGQATKEVLEAVPSVRSVGE